MSPQKAQILHLKADIEHDLPLEYRNIDLPTETLRICLQLVKLTGRSRPKVWSVEAAIAKVAIDQYLHIAHTIRDYGKQFGWSKTKAGRLFAERVDAAAQQLQPAPTLPPNPKWDRSGTNAGQDSANSAQNHRNRSSEWDKSGTSAGHDGTNVGQGSANSAQNQGKQPSEWDKDGTRDDFSDPCEPNNFVNASQPAEISQESTISEPVNAVNPQCTDIIYTTTTKNSNKNTTQRDSGTTVPVVVVPGVGEKNGEESSEESSSVDSTPQQSPAPTSKPKRRRGPKNPMATLEDHTLASLHYELILQINPLAKKPDLAAWAEEVNKIHRIDKYPQEMIEVILRWAMQHHFWQTVILSSSGLRRNFEKIIAQRTKHTGAPNGKSRPNHSTREEFHANLQRDLERNREREARGEKGIITQLFEQYGSRNSQS